MTSGHPVDLVLFDLGGVLVELGGVDALGALVRTGGGTDAVDEAVLWDRWLTSPWVRRFESGGCTPEAFAEGMVEEWGLPVGPAEFLTSFAAWPVGPLEGAEELVAEVAARVPVGCLSNTNALHYEERYHHWPLTRGFAHTFLSYRLGLVKPDAALFERVAGLLPVPRDRVLFLDDNAVNADGAAAVGFVGRQAVGVEGARAVLAEFGLVDR